MFSWLFKQGIKKEIKKEIDHVHNILHNSFGNIKQDIKDLHVLHKNKETKLKEYEERLIHIENFILNQIKKPEPSVIKQEIKSEEDIGKIYDILTPTHQRIFITLHQLQQRLDNSSISIKSLAKIIYPDKKYSNVRSTISEYLSFLTTIGLVSKIRQGRESFTQLTNLGLEYIEKLKEEGKVEKKLKIKQK